MRKDAVQIGINVVLVLLVVLIALWANQQSEDNNRHSQHGICVAINNLNGVITKTLQRSRHNLPKVAYYKDHPDELQTQLDEINQTLALFRPRTCK